MDARTPISLVVFDFDDTLTVGLDGGYICGVDYIDPGRSDYTFRRVDETHLERNDGQRFRLFSEVPQVLQALHAQGTLISLASYNHAPPVFAALQTLGLFELFQYPVVVFHGEKDRMLQQILQSFNQDGYVVLPENTLFVDDDPLGHYRRQMAGIGVNFLQRGVDIQSLDELLDHPNYVFVPAQHRA